MGDARRVRFAWLALLFAGAASMSLATETLAQSSVDGDAVQKYQLQIVLKSRRARSDLDDVKSILKGTAPSTDVSVNEFPYMLRLEPIQMGLPSQSDIEKTILADAKIGKASEATRIALCAENVTHIKLEDCKVEIERGLYGYGRGAQPAFFVTHLGYQITVDTPLTAEATRQIAESVRVRVRAAWQGQQPTDAVQITEVPLGKSANKPQQQTIVNQSPIVGSQLIASLWQNFNASIDQVDIIGERRRRLPTINIFDHPVTDGQTFDFSRWNDALKVSNEHPCPFDREKISHVDAVVGLLFPRLLFARLGNPRSDQNIRLEVPGAILSTNYLPGWGASPWFQPNNPTPVIAAAVYTGVDGGLTKPWARQIADGLTKSQSILIVSAAALSDVDNIDAITRRAFDPTISSKFDLTSEDVARNCRQAPFPSCLGKHPRVLVVVPKDNFGSYVVGASTVGMAASLKDVPVAFRCAADSADTYWGRSNLTGSSFGPTMIAAVIAKIVSSSTPDMPGARDPRFALFRVQATTTAQDRDDDRFASAVGFGTFDAGMALRGSSEVDEGSNLRAEIYMKDGSQPKSAVVAPYPWADNTTNWSVASVFPQEPGAGILGLHQYRRGTIVFQKRPGVQSLPMDFKNVLRISQSASSTDQEPLFDVYYIEPGNGPETESVAVARGVVIGQPAGTYPGVLGYCKLNGADDTNTPACLYAWNDRDPGGRFEGINLRNVKDIVFPLNHYVAGFIDGFDPVEFLLQPDKSKPSPWRDSLCRVRVPSNVVAAIASRESKFDKSKLYDQCN